MLKVIIIDDEILGAETLKRDLTAYCPEVTILGTAHTADEAEEKIKSLNPDLIFLDIEMPYASGFDLLSRFKEIHFDVIFTTAYNEYAIKAIKHNALDYLLKPVDHEELIAAVNKCIAKSAQQSLTPIRVEKLATAIAQQLKVNRLPVPTTDGIIYINTHEIIRLEGDQNYTLIHLGSNKKITSSKTLKNYELMLAGQNFFRVHKTHIINLSHVVKYIKGEGGYIQMTDGSSLEVSRQKKHELLGILSL